MMALNEWRRKNKAQVSIWFHLIGEAEVLNSLATLCFNQPRWNWPSFSEQHFTFEGTGIGHPLITEERRVVNDLEVHGTAKVALITGSNMAGKSTFLRSLGVNLLLAQMGAPVCAQRLVVSPVRLMTSMRIADNLAENTSTFYAELKKLKTIIEAIRRKEKVWVLLDEVLRGTNSMDRHIGLKALIRQIVNYHSVAVIATHDVEVAALADELSGTIENYHFDVQVEGEELYFDYKLKEGVCTSLNASILMKKIGIELD
jgi:DNA mismatch repair ATPase MutS